MSGSRKSVYGWKLPVEGIGKVMMLFIELNEYVIIYQGPVVQN